jgi:hypothetical protein
VTHHHHVEHAHVLVSKLVLAQEGHALVGIEADVASRGLQHTGKNLHEGGFSGTVGADQAVAVALAELDGDVFEQGLGPELHGDVVGGKHGDLSGWVTRMKADGRTVGGYD